MKFNFGEIHDFCSKSYFISIRPRYSMCKLFLYIGGRGGVVNEWIDHLTFRTAVKSQVCIPPVVSNIRNHISETVLRSAYSWRLNSFRGTLNVFFANKKVTEILFDIGNIMILVLTFGTPSIAGYITYRRSALTSY